MPEPNAWFGLGSSYKVRYETVDVTNRINSHSTKCGNCNHNSSASGVSERSIGSLREIVQNGVTVPIKPIKSIPELQNAVTVPKKPIKPIPQESWRLGDWASGLLRNWFYWFFWYSYSIWHYQGWFYWFLLRKTNKTNLKVAKYCNCTQKNNKTKSLGVLETGRLGLRTPEELVLLFFLYSCSILQLWDWFYWFYWYSCSICRQGQASSGKSYILCIHPCWHSFILFRLAYRGVSEHTRSFGTY